MPSRAYSWEPRQFETLRELDERACRSSARETCGLGDPGSDLPVHLERVAVPQIEMARQFVAPFAEAVENVFQRDQRL